MRILFLALMPLYLMLLSPNQCLSTDFKVDLLTDIDDSNPVYTEGDGTNSLRKCIRLANENFGRDSIAFTSTGIIQLNSDLPNITDELILDARGNGTVPTVVLRSSGVGIGRGFNVATGYVVIRGFVFQDFAIGIFVGNGYVNYYSIIQGNYFGTNLAGTAKENPIYEYGIYIENACNYCTIGGTTPENANVISGTAEGADGSSEPVQGGGIYVTGGHEYLSIVGNYIGTDKTGTVAIGNGNLGFPAPDATDGIMLYNVEFYYWWSGTGVTVQNNVISGNVGTGINMYSTDDVSIIGNKIGTNATGTAIMGNTGSGISVVESSYISIGGNDPALQNQISGNSEHGIFFYMSNNSSVGRNYIGVNNTGAAASGFGNGADGVRLEEATYQVVVYDNNIGGNIMAGVNVIGASSTDNRITRNSIFCNTGGGIVLDEGNQIASVAPTVITEAYSSMVAGTANSYSEVEVFIKDECGSGPQGKTYVITTSSDEGGNWSVFGNFTPNAKVTAVSHYNTYNTGLFSAPVDVIDCSAYSVTVGDDFELCSENPTVSLTGTVVGSTTSQWSVTSYSTFVGSFADENAITTTYEPHEDQVNYGYITFRLTATNTGTCPQIFDEITVDYKYPAYVDAGEDRNDCANELVNLYGYASAGGEEGWSGDWSTLGSGYFMRMLAKSSLKGLADQSIDGSGDYTGGLYAFYVPSSADTAQGYVDLILTADTIQGCSTTKDTVRVNFIEVPIVRLGPDQGMCRLNTSITLSAEVYGATGQFWSSNGEASFSSFTEIPTTYTPTEGDIEAGFIEIRLSAGSLVDCPTVEDEMLLYFVDAPIVDAGEVQLVCSGDTLDLEGIAIGASSVQWTSSGTGSFLNSTSVSTRYIPSDLDKSNVLVLLTLSAQGQDACSDSIDVTSGVIVPPPNVGNGAKFSICPESNITINAPEIGAGLTGTWTKLSGTGTFSASNTSTIDINGIEDKENVFRWTVTNDQLGCTSYADYTVYKCYQPEITVYNAVTPNGDGKHEFLEIENIDAYVETNKVLIYNRWGDLVFEMTGYNNDDKVFNGFGNIDTAEELTDGIYYYVIIKNEDMKAEKGYLVLKK